ncbi:hypothetical protein Vadar_011394 [Vaccinium darrowii]|uniref:Uncharacterized protein n=1 Tax=Vaccinium darrowii TaxID=229202 RepID=A0ACB7YKV5_9ERIC|nr:hypothetical protein Vadar_011394 [Vaccinium darrowii]
MRNGGPKDRPRFREIKRPDMPTNKPERVAPTKKRRHASTVASSQGSCTGEIDLQEVCGRQASPVNSPQNFSTGEANLRKLHQILPFIAASLLEDSIIFDSISLSLSSSSSEEDEPVILKHPQRTFPISGQEYTTWLLNGHPDVMREMLRVDAHTFRALVNLLVKKGHLKKWDHMRLSVEESLAIFLYICGHGKRQRCAAYQFRHSTTTISRHFKYMRRALCNVARSVIRPPDLSEIPPEILRDKKYYLWFQNCVGAIGITGIEAGVPASDQATHRGRKVKIAQKVMAACSFDEKFTFVYAGWESYACDSQIFAAAVSNPCNMFPHPPARMKNSPNCSCGAGPMLNKTSYTTDVLPFSKMAGSQGTGKQSLSWTYYAEKYSQCIDIDIAVRLFHSISLVRGDFDFWTMGVALPIVFPGVADSSLISASLTGGLSASRTSVSVRPFSIFRLSAIALSVAALTRSALAFILIGDLLFIVY